MFVGCTVKMIRMRTRRQLRVGDFMQRSGPGWGMVISSILAAGTAAGCFAYLWRPLTEVDHPKLPSHVPALIVQDSEPSVAVGPARNQPVEAFQRAADAILSRATNLTASAPAIRGQVGAKVPLPRRRPLSKP
jgi:hypothetical protein